MLENFKKGKDLIFDNPGLIVIGVTQMQLMSFGLGSQ